MNDLRIASVALLCVLSLLLAGCTGNRESDVTCAHPEPVLFGQEEKFEDRVEVPVSFQSGCATLEGTLYLPQAGPPEASLVFVHGAGETLRLHPGQAVLDELVEQGIAVFSFDKRGVGASQGECCAGDSARFDVPANDVLSAVNAIRWRRDIAQAPVGLLGVSQAGWIIPIVATKSPDIAFVILISGPAVSVGASNHYDKLTDQGVPRDEALRRLFEAEESIFDPAPFLTNLTPPGLWLYGEKDEDQPTPASVEALEHIADRHGKNFTAVVFPGAGHELGNEPELMPTVTSWLNGVVDAVSHGD